MNSLLFYIISTGVCLSLFILTYLLLLKNNTRFNLCRFYLIAAILFSFIIPFITIDVGFSFISKNETITNTAKPIVADKIEVQELETIPAQIETSNWNIDYSQTAGIIFISIALLLLIRFIFRFGSIILIQTSGNRFENEDGTNLIFTDRTDNAFSFLGSIFINPLKFTDEEKRLIIEHEREHIRHLHSIDLILIELLIVLQWFNPFAYIARRKLIEIHEFIADNGVIQKGADPYSYQNLLLSVVSSSCLPTVGNQLSALITKKRIAMIGKPLNQTGRWINFLVLVPIAIILIIGTSAFNPRPIERNINNEKTHSIILKDSTTFKFLKKRAQSEIKDTWLKDINLELASNSSQSYNFILKKECIYNIYMISEDNSENIGMKIVYNKSETEKETVADNIFKYPQLSFITTKTGSFTIIISNPTAVNKKALLVLTLKGYNKIVEKNSNNQNLQYTKNDTEEPFMVVEQMPVFGNGNEGEFESWVNSNIQYPKESAEKGVQGRVFVKFVIEKDGTVTNAKVAKGVDPILDKEALRVVLQSPKWKPGMQRGKIVRVYWTTPVSFLADNGNRPSQTSSNQDADEQAFKVLEKRAQNEIKEVLLKDFRISVKPSNSITYSLILKKGINYTFNFLTDIKNTDVICSLSLKSVDEMVADLRVKNEDFSKLEYTPKETGVYLIQIDNKSPNNLVALVYLSIKDTAIPEQQSSSTIKMEEQKIDDDEVFQVVEQMPVFGNGIEGEFRTWVATNMQYPKEAADKGIQGRVFVQFVIEKDGSITNAKVLRGVDSLLDKEAIRVIQQSPKWKPGMQKGKIIRVQYTFPITFMLN